MMLGDKDYQEKQSQVFRHRYFRDNNEFRRYYLSLKYLRPIVFIFNFIIAYFLLRFIGFRVMSILVVIFISLKEIINIFFLLRLEKRIFQPIDMLKDGVEEIRKGNYAVQIESNIPNEIGVLITSFNEMAQELQASERMKQEYEENRKKLIASISHDLKTPITSINGYIEAILEGVVNSPEKLTKYLNIIQHNAVYINKLIDDLFLFSKLDIEKLDFRFEKVQIRAFMNDVMEEFRFELEEKQFNFSYKDKLEADCLINMDRKRIYQVIRNIIGNAVKFGTEEIKEVRVELDRQGDFVQIDIHDNGPGIPEEKLPYIFDRFYRVDRERTKDLLSTGLGLAIAKELVEAHGGKITASSVEKVGSSFTIIFPMAEEEEVK